MNSRIPHSNPCSPFWSAILSVQRGVVCFSFGRKVHAEARTEAEEPRWTVRRDRVLTQLTSLTNLRLSL